jgi:xanthine dehydrogenase accessory factor
MRQAEPHASVAELPQSGVPFVERPLALVKGAGDLATGVALRLHRSGFSVLMTEIPAPTAVRRSVAFSEAVYMGGANVEKVHATLVPDVGAGLAAVGRGEVGVIVDPATSVLRRVAPVLLVDAIVAKRNLGTSIADAPAVVALGPGFLAGRDAHAVVETSRGHTLGRVITEGTALPDTGVPGEIGGHSAKRILRAPADGVLRTDRPIGAQVAAGDIVALVDEVPVHAAISGMLRGLLRPGSVVTAGMKIGDIDPRASRADCESVSDKSLAVAGGVLEAACSLLGGVRFD